MATGITAYVFDIQRFSLEDGPGLRTLVFLKGCPLRCAWCSNPESQSTEPEFMYDDLRCTACGTCVRACTSRALTVASDAAPIIQPGLCDFCGNCVTACPSGARWICGRWISVDDVVTAIRRDVPFYRRSAGGVTLGGGEPVWQPAFSLELLSRAKDERIDTTIETCGYGDRESVVPLLMAADHVYFDLKHADTNRHLELTGASNETILANLSLLLVQHGDVTIRYPLVPDCNDQPGDIAALAQLLLGLPRTPRVEIVPYHRYGEHKYRLLQRHYPLSGITVPGSDDVQGVCHTLQHHGIACEALTL